MRLFVRACCCVLVLAGIAFAQSDRGTITGTIKDPAGAMIPGATIKAKNLATGAEYPTASTNTGNFTLAQLPAATYELVVTMTGFKSFIRQGITVGAAQTLRVDVTLEVGAITETVTVNAEAPLLKTESGELSHNVRSDTLDSLPVLSIGAGAGSTGIRNPYAVMQVLPGVDWRPDASVRVNGAPGNTQALRVEGMDATNNMWQQQGQVVQQGVDAIQELAVQTSNYAAEFGQAGAAVFNLTMKSGTNALHGSAYEYFVNEALNASTPNYRNDGNPDKIRPRSRRNDYGFTLGGPIYIPKIYDGRDKSFFFFTFEQYRMNSTASNAATVPTLAMRQGDFSQILGNVIYTDSFGRQIRENQIFDWTHPHTVNGITYWDPFPNNQIPSSLFDTSSALIQAKIPQPINSQLTNNWLAQTANTSLAWIPSVKIDYSLSPRAKLSGYYSRNYSNTTIADGLPAEITTQIPNLFISQTVRINFDYTLRPTMLLHVGAGMMRNYMDQFPQTSLDVKSAFQLLNTQATTLPYFQLMSNAYGGFSQNMGAGVKARRLNYKPTANPSLTWVRGNHAYKFGGELIVESHQGYIETFANNWYSFASGQTADPSLAYVTSGGRNIGSSTGSPYASFLTGRVNFGYTNAPSRGHLGSHSLAFYMQDSWKITPKLTLDYGLRYDYQTYLKEQYGRWANFSPTTPNPGIISTATGQPLLGATIFEGSGPGHCNCDYANTYKYAFGPRIGLAYQIAPKTVLRAGIGISYGRTPELGYLDNTISSFVNYGLGNAPGTAASLVHTGPPANYQVVWPDIRADAFPRLPSLNAPAAAFDRNAGRPPRTVQWSFGLQRELTKDLILDASYVGNRGAWWQANGLIDVDGLTPEYLKSLGLDITQPADRTLLTTTYSALSAANKARFPIPFVGFPVNNQPLVQALRPFPQFAGVNYLWAPLGRTWYDSLQVKLTKRFSHNFDLSYSFTYQKEMTMGSELSYQIYGTINPQANDTANRATNKYISGLSRPFMNVIAASYTVPKAFGGSRLLNTIVGDWQISTLLRYTSAQPIRIPNQTGNINVLLGRASNSFAQRVPGQPLFADQNGNPVDINGTDYDPAATFVLNPKAWTDPTPGTFSTSTAYYNDYRGRRHPTENMSLARNFRLGKEGRYTLQLRAEFNNIFNRLYIPNPSSTTYGQTQTYLKSNPNLTASGFGYINMSSATVASGVRTGQIVARFSF